MPFLLLAALAGCTPSGNVKQLEQENQVQNQRLLALEKSSGGEISKLVEEVEAIQKALRAAEGKIYVLKEKTDKMEAEQRQLSGGMEKTLATMRGLTRKIDKSSEGNEKLLTEQARELDAIRLKLNDIEKMMQSPIASMPVKTAADKDYRWAYAAMISGELDIAADRFLAFSKSHGKDPRAVDALYWRGQSFFLLRKYDHALVSFFELVEKHPRHKLAAGARWMLARGLEETGDLKLARDFYSQLIADNTIHKADATRRLHFINRLFGNQKPAKRPEKPGKPAKSKG